MALDRTWYNTLVDDDGSGLTGSVWDKADVDALMDAIDAEFVRVQSWAQAFNPILVGTGGGTPIYAGASGLYTKVGSIVHVSAYVAVSSLGSLAGNISLGNLPFAASSHMQQSAFHSAYYGGLVTPAMALNGYMNANATSAQLTFTIAAGGLTIMTAAHLTNGFNALIAGTYLTN
jgi:hypothetical protein